MKMERRGRGGGGGVEVLWGVDVGGVRGGEVREGREM